MPIKQVRNSNAGGVDMRATSGCAFHADSGGSFEVNNLGNLNINSGGQLTLKSGGLAVIAAGSGFNVDGVAQIRNAAFLNVLSGGEIDVKSGGNITCDNGSLAAFLGQVGLGDGGGGGSNGQMFIGGFFGTGHVLVAAGSDITIQPDGFLYVGGSSGGHPGKIEVQNFGKLQLDSGGTLDALAGSAVNLGGTTTQTGGYTKSGAGGWTSLRVGTIPIGSNPSTINAWEADIWVCPALLADQTVNCAQAPLGVVATFIITGTPVTMAHDLLVQDHIAGSLGSLMHDNMAGTTQRGTLKCYYGVSRTAQFLLASPTFATAP